MIALENALPITNVLIDSPADSLSEAIEKAVAVLKNDARILDWTGFRDAVWEREKKSPTNLGRGLLLPHARGEFTSSLTLSCVRLRDPIPAEGAPIQVVLAVAIPSSMNAEYLRIVGALARVFKDEKCLAHFSSLTTTLETRDWLATRCRA